MKEITAQEFRSLINAKSTFVLHFWADWNGYDIEQKEYFEALDNGVISIPFYQMNIDAKENIELCKAHNVMGPPTIAFYQNGKLQERVVGIMKEQHLKDKLCALSIV